MRRRRRAQLIGETATATLLIGGAAVFAADLARRIYRHTQLFCPAENPVKSWNPADYGIPADRVTEKWFETPDGELLYGWYVRAEKPIASALFCHGNTGNLTNVAEVMPHLVAAGFNVFLFDYRGFGLSTGIPSISGVVADTLTAAKLHDELRPEGLPSILYGFSLGGAIAAQAVKRHRFDGLILQSTFTTFPDITRVTFPRLPLHHFAGDFFNTLGVVRKLHVPLLVLHGTSDEVVPCWMAHALHDACPTAKRIYTVDGALHKDMFVRDPDKLIWAINQFVAELPHAPVTLPMDEEDRVEAAVDAALRFVRRRLRKRAAAAALTPHHA